MYMLLCICCPATQSHISTQNPRNHFFLLLSDSTIPLYPALVVYMSLITRNTSAVQACAETINPDYDTLPERCGVGCVYKMYDALLYTTLHSSPGIIRYLMRTPHRSPPLHGERVLNFSDCSDLMRHWWLRKTIRCGRHMQPSALSTLCALRMRYVGL